MSHLSRHITATFSTQAGNGDNNNNDQVDNEMDDLELDLENLDDIEYDFESMGDLSLDMGVNFGDEAAATGPGSAHAVDMEEDKYADILDPKNPPKLSREHYEMLKDVANIQPTEEELRKWRDDNYHKRKQEQQTWSDKFGITKDMYEAYLNTFPGSEESADFKKLNETDKPPVKGYDFTREPGRTFSPDDVEALEHVPGWVPMSRGRKPDTCMFCIDDVTSDREYQVTYTNVELLYKFINERGMITSRSVNHNCAKHQRKIGRSIKRARQLGLIPFVSNWKAPRDIGAVLLGNEQQGMQGGGLGDMRNVEDMSAEFDNDDGLHFEDGDVDAEKKSA